jgi:hypothetical protein
MGPDGLSYLDMASEAVSDGPSSLVNAIWSPCYPALISIAIFLFRPSPGHEFPLVHFVNFFVFILALSAFSFFLHFWLETTHRGEIADDSAKTYVTPFAFSTFLWFTLKWIGVDAVCPDLGVAAIVFVAAGIGCRLSLPDPRWGHYVTLGLVLGAGYYFKAAMLPLGLALLVLLFFLLPRSSGVPLQKRVTPLALSLVVFLLAATPLAAALSIRAHKLTFGDAGRLNYLWHVNRLLWSGGYEPTEPDTTPEHPAPKLLTVPLTLAFASPIKGTYPLWYDPSYWYAGIKATFNLRQQVAALLDSCRVYKDLMVQTIAYLSGAIALCLLGAREKLSAAVFRNVWWQLAWVLIACAMFALVHVEMRYVAPLFVLLWLNVYHVLMSRVTRQIAAAVCVTVAFTVMAPFMDRVAAANAHNVSGLVHPRLPDYQTAALALRALGLQNGDRLAIVGYAYNCYYARCARLQVVAQIPDAHAFWRLSAPELQAVLERLASVGVKAVVATNRPDAFAQSGWKDVSESDSGRLSVLLLTQRRQATAP